MTVTQTETTHVYRVYIKATPQAIWDAITDPQWNRRYGYQAPGYYELRPGGGYRAQASDVMKEQGAPDVILEGEVLEVDAPRRLVQTWHALFSPEMAAEPATRLTWELREEQGGVCRLTVTHDVTGAPMLSAQVSGEVEDAGGGWAWVLSDLKTLMETGKAFEN